VKGVLGENSDAFCRWLGIEGNFNFTTSLAASMPEGPLYLAWENPEHCVNQYKKLKRQEKTGRCVVLSDSPTAVADSMEASLRKTPHDRNITIRIWDKGSKAIIERRFVKGR
jgi:hypothetical protein